MEIKKAVFPVAGLGSRFLPATKANPKEMLPVVDKPLIQYAVEEAVRAGLSHMIFVTSHTKRAIEDHFDTNYELETRLEAQGKHDLLKLVKQIAPSHVQFTYVRQSQPLGLGHAILCAQHVVGHEPFAVILADDLIDDAVEPCLSAMVEGYQQTKQSIIGIQPTAWEQVHQYGVVDVIDSSAIFPQLQSMIEKPSRDQAPSNLVAIGRYIFTPGIFHALKYIKPDHRGEIQLTDGIKQLLCDEKIYAWPFLAKRFDCGDKLGYLKATVEMGLSSEGIGQAFKVYLEQLLARSYCLTEVL